MEYVRRHCDQQRGRKAALAKYLGVQPHMVSAWLDKKEPVKPNAENALGMVEWLQKQSRPPAVPAI
ncbi:hypothetical protein [Prosthecobacter sp.]|uniref:hypothetical protein n=1 Tax=Prosthecobacter sp. TaxID=1965333 RepID=UPI003783C05F